MIIDFEATDVSKEAEATQLGWHDVSFNNDGDLIADAVYHHSGKQTICGHSRLCKPDRAISFGAMAVSHITHEDVNGMSSHKVVVPQYLPKGAAYIIGHNIDYDIQVAANAGVDTSQYKRICTQALARKLLPDLDSHSLGALTYAINPELARKYCRNAHDAGWDVTFTLWLLEHLCDIANITSMEQLYLASEDARIPTVFTFGKHAGKLITDVRRTDPSYLRWIVKNHDNAYLVKACLDVITRNIDINV
jgi:exodeoxyribonuclease X